MEKISIIGGGAFGFAIATYLAKKNYNISLFDINRELIEFLRIKRKHKFYFTNIKLSKKISPTSNIKECLKNSNLIVLCVPSCFIRDSLKNIKKVIKKNIEILNLSKGLEPKTNKRISEIISDEFTNYKYGVLSGGMLAEDVIKNKKLSATIASKNNLFLNKLYSIFKSKNLKIVKSKDVIGVELCGPLKNIIAIFIGILQGLNKDKNTINQMLNKFSNEAKKLAIDLGGKKSTFSMNSPAWHGDLMVSCFGNSRNRTFGIEIGKNKDVNYVIEKMKLENKLIEGYSNVKIFYNIIKAKNIKYKFFCTIYEILYKNKDIEETINKL